MAEACLYLMRNYEDSELVNIGSGKEISIKELAEIIRDVVGFREILCSMPQNPTERREGFG